LAVCGGGDRNSLGIEPPQKKWSFVGKTIGMMNERWNGSEKIAICGENDPSRNGKLTNKSGIEKEGERFGF
jgi:hypothetical protein